MLEEMTKVTQEEYPDFCPNAVKLFYSVERIRRQMRAASNDDSLSAISPRFQEFFAVIVNLYSILLKVGNNAIPPQHH